MLGTAARVRIWDAALAAIRACLRARGLREVLTPVRVAAPALEPFIEPLAASGGFLRTSPELAHKRLLAHGADALFEIAAVYRSGERGDRHMEGFHLVEWYRRVDDPALLRADVEALVRAVFEAVTATGEGLARVAAPPVGPWPVLGLRRLLGETLDPALRENPPPEAVFRALEAVRQRAGVALGPGAAAAPAGSALSAAPLDDPRDPVALAIWSELFSWWSDLELESRARALGAVHVDDFPPALAALARIDGGGALRFETWLGGVELANGYVELRDEVQQRARFEAVAALRASSGLPELPLDDAFLGALRAPGLPPCAGVALGLERLLALACGARTLDAIVLFPSDPA